jgi:signal peptidase I
MKASASTRAWIAKFLILSAVAILAFLGITWITVRVCFPAFIMSSASMENTILRGDTFLVNRLATWRGRLPGRGDIVAYRWPLHPDEWHIHRVVGVPGDRLKTRDQKLYRNGVELTEPYAQHISTLIDAYRDNFPNVPNFPLQKPAVDMLENHVVNGEVVVPADHYFVMGDNRDDAMDSRYIGFIQRSDIIGRALVVIVSRDPKRTWRAPR